MINGSTLQKDITTGNIYAPNIKPPKYIRHILTDPKVKIDNSTKAVGYFSTPNFSNARLVMVRSSRQKNQHANFGFKLYFRPNAPNQPI